MAENHIQIVKCNYNKEMEKCRRKIMPFQWGKCTACSEEFCGKHRLPESHSCPWLDEWVARKRYQNNKRILEGKCAGNKINKDI